MPRKEVSVAVLATLLKSFHTQVFRGFRLAAERDPVYFWEMTCYFAHGPDHEKMRRQAQEALKGSYSYIFSVGAMFTKILHDEMQAIGIKKPVIFAGTGHPKDIGLIASPDKPEGNFTGVEMESSPPTLPIHILNTCFPQAKRIILPYYSSGRAHKLKSIVESIKTEASSLNISLDPCPLDERDEIHTVDTKKLSNYDALLFVEGGFVGEEMAYLRNVCTESKTLISASGLYCASEGAACSYGAGIEELGFKAFDLMRQLIILDTKPQDTPVKIIPDTGSIVINERAVYAQGGHISPKLRSALMMGSIKIDGHYLPIHLHEDHTSA